jgi:hypothetical protein
MDNENIKRQMEFIINQQAQFSADIIELKGQMAELTSTVANLAGTVGNLVGIVGNMAGTIDTMAGSVENLAETVEANRAEMREAINNLIVANEVTRELAENAARLTVQTSQRVTDLESNQ